MKTILLLSVGFLAFCFVTFTCLILAMKYAESGHYVSSGASVIMTAIFGNLAAAMFNKAHTSV